MKGKKYIKIIALILCAVIVIAVGAITIGCKTTDIPKLNFEGNIEGMVDKSDVRDIAFTYDDGETVTKGYATVKIQGTSSQWYPKKNYTINFYADEAHEEKLKIDLGMGWGAQSKYCLKANWIDRTHARNVVTARLVTQMQRKYDLFSEAPRNGAVDGFPIEVHNNGAFHGLYTFNIPKDAWQFNMDKDNPNHIVICDEDVTPVGLFHEMPNFESWSVEVGEDNDETLEKMNRLFDFVINSTDEEFKANFDQYLNLDATLNYYIMAEFGQMRDNVGKNMLLATYDGEVWYPSLYDLDTTWGSDYNGKRIYDYVNEEVPLLKNNLFARTAELFQEELVERYFELRQDVLTKTNIMDQFHAFRAQIPMLTFAQETVKWGTGLFRLPSDLPGYDYDQIEEYLDYMIPVLDAKYTALRNG
ncbi:MAG: CotH kinase family protein [Faecousia sp.]